MIQINLLNPSHAARPRPWLPAHQRPAAIALLTWLVAACGVIAWWSALHRETRSVDLAIASAQTDFARQTSLVALVDRASARKAELAERLAFIDRLRHAQGRPAELLEVVSRSLPDGAWLLDLKQQNDRVHIEGRAMDVTAIADFVDQLQTSGLFRRPVDIVSTSLDTAQDVSVVHFAIDAVLMRATPAPGASATSTPSGM